MLTFSLLQLVGCSAVGLGGKTPPRKIAVYYNIKKGDTIEAISKRYGAESDSVMLLNGIHSGETLTPGQRLLLGYRYEDRGETKGGEVKKLVSLETPKGFKNDGKLLWPVDGGRIVSTFGPRFSSFHDGLDIAATTGTPVFAAADGRVVYSGDGLSGYGNLIILRHKNGLITIYAHNTKLHVDAGDSVRKGENISDVGATGHASGPHLHFEVRMQDKQQRYVAVDPMPLLFSSYGNKPRFRVNESLNPILARKDDD